MKNFHIVAYSILIVGIILAFRLGKAAAERDFPREGQQLVGHETSAPPAPTHSSDLRLGQGPLEGDKTGEVSVDNLEYRLRAIMNVPRSPASDKELGEVVYALGRLLKGNALPYIEKLEGSTKEIALSTLLMGWASIEPKAAWEHATLLAEGSGREWIDAPYSNRLGMMLNLVTAIYREGRGSELPSLINEMPDGSSKDSVAGFYARILARYDTDAAMTYIEELSGASRRVAVRSVVQDMARAEPAKTVEWAVSLPGEDAAPALKVAVSEWLDREGGQPVVNWMASKPPSVAKDEALNAFILEARLEVIQNNPQIMEFYSNEKAQKSAQRLLSTRLEGIQRRLAPAKGP